MTANGFCLSSYRLLLETGLSSGYEFLGFDEIGKESSPYSCLLRHDLDAELWDCSSMAELETQMGIRSTYFIMLRSTAYNLLCLESLKVVEDLLRGGHRIGLHFMGELCAGMDAQALAEKVVSEVALLGREFGASISAVSFHQPSRFILENDLEIPGLVNTYNKRQTGRYFYVSDTNMQWRHENPIQIFSRHLYPRLQLLIHPLWWTPQAGGIRDKWLRILETSRRVLVRHWQERERTLRDSPLEHPRPF